MNNQQINQTQIMPYQTYRPATFDFSQIISYAAPLLALGFVSSMVGAMVGMMGGSSSNPVKEKVTVKCPICGKVIEVGEYDTVTRSDALKRHLEAEHGHHSNEEEEIRYELDQMLKSEWIEHYDYVVEMLGRKGYSKETVKKVLDEEIRRLGEKLTDEKVSSGHHSMWLTPEQRKELEKKYGAVAVRWGEEIAPVGDIAFVERAAAKWLEKIKTTLAV